jgi:hypothetical protein
MTTLSTQLEALAQKMTPGDLSTAERHIASEYVECPFCAGQGEVEAADYCNFDGVALGVQFYGIGHEFGVHEQVWTLFAKNIETIIEALREKGL